MRVHAGRCKTPGTRDFALSRGRSWKVQSSDGAQIRSSGCRERKALFMDNAGWLISAGVKKVSRNSRLSRGIGGQKSLPVRALIWWSRSWAGAIIFCCSATLLQNISNFTKSTPKAQRQIYHWLKSAKVG